MASAESSSGRSMATGCPTEPTRSRRRRIESGRRRPARGNRDSSDDLADDATGVTGGKYVLGDVACDHAAGADDGPRADPDARADDRRPADPDVRADLDRLTRFLGAAENRVHRVSGAIDLLSGATQVYVDS